MSLLWALRQEYNITSAQGTAAQARSKADRVQEELGAIKRRLDRMTLATQARWEILRDRSDLAEEDILVKMQEIDLRDGTADGRIGAQILVCPSCKRRSNSTRDQCIYCGGVLYRQHLFE